MEYKNVEIDACELIKKANEAVTHLDKCYRMYFKHDSIYCSCTGLTQGITKTIGKRERPYHVNDIMDLINHYLNGNYSSSNNNWFSKGKAAVLSRALISLGYIPIKSLSDGYTLIDPNGYNIFVDIKDGDIFTNPTEDEIPIEEIKKTKRGGRHAKVSSHEQDCHHEDNSLTVDASVFTTKVPHIGDPNTRNIVISSSCMKTGRFIVLDNGQTIIITDD